MLETYYYTMYQSIISIFLLLIIAACSSNTNKSVETKFTIREVDINIHGAPRSVRAFNNLLVGLLDGGGFFVLDSNFKSVDSAAHVLNKLPDDIWAINSFDKYLVVTTEKNQLFIFDTAFNRQAATEQRLSKLGVTGFYRTVDDFFAQTPGGIYYLDSNFNTTGFKDTTEIMKHYNWLNWQYPAYIDSNYYVYVCGAGEWGGNIYFLNRKTGKWYLWPCYYSDLFFYKGKYHLIDELGKFSTIDNPSRLPAADSDVKGIYNNCKTRNGISGDKHGVHTYFDTSRAEVLGSFFYNDKLHSLLSGDSLWILRHDADSVKYLKAYPLAHKHIYPYYVNKMDIWGGSIMVFGSRSLMGDSLQNIVEKMSMLFIKNNKIYFYNYELKRVDPKLLK